MNLKIRLSASTVVQFVAIFKILYKMFQRLIIVNYTMLKVIVDLNIFERRKNYDPRDLWSFKHNTGCLETEWLYFISE